MRTLFRATGVEGRTTVSRTALDGLVRTVLGAGDDSRVTSDMLREVFDHSHALADLDLPVNLDTLRGFHALSRLVGSDPTRQRLDDLAHELVGGPRGPRTTADLVEVAAVVHRGGRVTRAGLLAGLNVKPAQREGRSTEGARAGGSRERLRPQDRSGSDGAGSGGSRDRVRREDRPAPEAVRTDSHAAPEPAGKADPRKMLTDYLRGRAARVADWSERRILRFMAHRVFEVPVEGTLPSDAYPRLERLALTAHESGIPFSLENIHALRQLLDAAPRRQGVAGETPEHVDRVVRDVMSLPPGTAVDSGHRTTVVALARYLREELKRPVTLTGTRALRALTDLSPVAGDSDPGHILRDLARRVLPDLPDLPDPADPAAGPAAVTRLLELASTVDRHPLDIDTLRAAARGGLDGTRRDTASRPAPDAMEIGTPDAWRSPSPDDSSVASTPTATGSAQPGTPDSHRSSSDESLASEVHAFDEMTITAPAMPILAEPSHALPAPPPGFHGNDAFWQAIGGDRRTGRRLTENEYLRFVEETGEGGGRPLGFVINTMVSHKDVGQIREVLDAITQGMEGMDNRVAVVVGVNAESGSETQLNEAVSATRRAVADLGLPVAVVPATFKPKGGRFPYGRMRNAVMHDEATRQLIGAMVKNGLHPYLSVQDFDRGSRMTAEGGHIFNRVERQLRIEHGDLPPVRPLAYIGGYRMPDRADLHRLLTETINRYPVGKVPPELVDPELADHHLDRLQEAVRRDMIARQNQARIHPLLPYAPEPNLFVDGAAVLLRDDRGGPRLSWGEGAAEFARLGQDLNQLNGWELRQHHEPHMDGRAGSVPVPDSRTPARENRSMPRGRDEIHAQVAADAANNRLPHRGEAFRTDFVDGATSTDLSRLSQTLIDKNGVLGQTHANLTTVLDRLFQGKSAKDGVELAAVRKIYAPRSRDVYETQQPLRPRTGGATPGQPSELPMASKLGDRPENVLNSAVSAPVGGPFTAEAGIQGEHKLHAALELALSTEELILGRKLAYVRFEPDILGHRELSRLDVFPTRPRPAQGVGRRDQPVRSESGVPADGDCLYHAVNAVRRIDVGPDTALHLRNTVLDWMLTPDNLTQVVRFANERGVDINDLVTTIALSGNWHGPAGDLAATMVASALNARLVIDADGTEHTVTPLRVPGRGRSRPLQPGQVIRLRLSGNHYEPVGRTVLGGDDGGAGRATKRRRSPEDGPGRGTKRSHTSDARRTETSAAGPSRPRSAGRQDAPRGGGASARQHRAEDTEMTDANPTEGVRKFGGADRTPASEEQVTRSGGDPISEMVEALCSAHASGTRLLQGEGSDPGRAAAVARFPRDERFFSVAIHTGGDGTPVWNGQDVTPAEFAVVLAELHERGVWDGETPLQFPACRFGDGHEYSFAAETMLLLHEQLPHLPLEAYAPDGDLWHVPSVLPDGGLDHVGPGHLVVGDGVVIDSSGRPRVVPGGGWLRMTVDPHDGELFVDELGAHLVVDGEQRPNTQPVPPGYTLSEGGSHDALDQAVSFGRGTASPGEQHGRPVPYDPGDGPPSPAGANVAHWVGDGHPDAAVQARTSRALARVPDADRYFTVAMHIGAQHRPVRDGAVMSAQAFAEHVLALRDGGAWDGERPLRLVACDLAADPSFVADVMRVLWDRGVRADAYAADGPVWFTPLGGGTSELVASRAVGFKATPDGVKPALLPGTGWVRFSPPAHAGGQAVTEPVGPLLRPRTESPFVDAGPDEHLTPAAGAVSFGADHPARRDRPDLPTDQGPAPVHAPPLPQTGTRTVPSRRDARPSVLIDNYRVVTAHGDGPPPGGSLAERSRRAAFSRRDAYRNGGRVVQTGTGHDAQTFPVHRAVRSLITEDHPQVRLSHDASLAIAQVAGRPKEFYALPEVVERGNVRLRQNGSEARLVLNDEVSIEFEHDQRTVRLFKVSVEFDGDPSGICRDFSHDVLGGTHTHAVLHDVRPPEEGGTGSTAIAFVNTASDAEVGGTHHLVAGLMDSAGRNDETEAGPQWAKTLTEKARTQPERDWPTPGEKYGRALNRSHPAGAGLRRELTRKVRSTGINEEAWAQPGEAYLMQAVSHKTSGWERLFTHDFSRTVEGASEERPTTWGYHFAPVVVESLDGTHQITLENARFNRRSRALLDETLTATIEHYRPRIDEIRSELGQQVERGELSPGDPRLELARLIVQIRETEHELAKPATASDHPGAARHEDPSHRTALLESALKQARTEARRALLTISGEDMGLDGDMWWFSMHGRAKGENFFETRAMLDDTTARGTMTNPVVLVLASGLDNARLDLEPDPSTQRLSAHDVARLESLAGRIAKGALWRIRQGMSLPEIRITSHALPGERSQGTVQRDQVSTRLREILDARLEAIQRDDASISQPVRAHHFRVVEDLEIRDPDRVRALMGGSDGDGELPVHPQVRVEVHLDEHPADRVDHTPEQLADLARQTGLRRGGPRLGSLGGQQTPMDDTLLARMRDIIGVGRRLDGQEGEPGLTVLTGVRRLSDVLAREYGHTGELRVGHLDPLVRDVLGLGFSAEVTTADRLRLLDIARSAKVRGRPLTVESLTRTARLGSAGGAPDTGIHAEEVQAGPSRPATEPTGPSRRPIEDGEAGRGDPATVGSGEPVPPGDRAEPAEAGEPTRTGSPAQPGSDRPGTHLHGADSPSPDLPVSDPPGQGPSVRLPMLDWSTSVGLADPPSEPAAADRPVRASDAGGTGNGAVRSAHPQYGTAGEEAPVSRIGKLRVPAGVDVTLDGRTVAVKGPKGSLTHTVAAPIEIAKDEDGMLLVTRPDDERVSKALHGLSRALVANMITGVTAGYSKQLEISGVGYRVQAKGADLEFALGYSHPILVQPPEGVSFTVESPTRFSVEGIDKQKVGEVAAYIRDLRMPEPYKAKGVGYAGEVIREIESRADDGPPTMTPVREPFAGGSRRHSAGAGGQPLPGPVGPATEGEQQAGHAVPHQPSLGTVPEPPGEPEPEPAAAEPSRPRPRSVADVIADVLSPAGPGPHPPAPRGPSRTG
ncbi:50S ribosomal protein L6 [Streptomyces sp.]|uniref:50S ribosomal protein L6 n=1 Tax=Streptomyces sp. TaxID=1931 RepID=UPI002F4098DE